MPKTQQVESVLHNSYDEDNNIIQFDLDKDKPYTMWCFTWNNYTTDNIEYLKTLDYTYLVFGQEIAPKTGTPHLQGTIFFKKKTRFAGVKKLLEHCNISPTRNVEKSIIYCKKDGKFFEDDKRCAGKRTDLADAVALVKSSGLLAVLNTYPTTFLKYHKGLQLAESMFRETEPKLKPLVIWIWGLPGANKTRSVCDYEGCAETYISEENLNWWGGYYHQDAALLDDFRESSYEFVKLLRLMDAYPFRVQNKGGSKPFTSKRLYITSCYHPKDVYTNLHENLEQLYRRIDIVIKVDPPIKTKSKRRNLPFNNCLTKYYDYIKYYDNYSGISTKDGVEIDCPFDWDNDVV